MRKGKPTENRGDQPLYKQASGPAGDGPCSLTNYFWRKALVTMRVKWVFVCKGHTFLHLFSINTLAMVRLGGFKSRTFNLP